MEKGHRCIKIKSETDVVNALQRIANAVLNESMDLATARVLDKIICTRIQFMRVCEQQQQIDELMDIIEHLRGEED